ncbi:hypothetical protein C8F01DRAFT_1094366 [Mycena amicta]|nr:hypothetical protein C8F01DRAFT_1094366 [Mycena amicta]
MPKWDAFGRIPDPTQKAEPSPSGQGLPKAVAWGDASSPPHLFLAPTTILSCKKPPPNSASVLDRRLSAVPISSAPTFPCPSSCDAVMANVSATIENSNPKFAPTLKKGTPSLETLRRFEELAFAWGKHEKIADDDLTERMMDQFEDTIAITYIRNVKATLPATPFSAFMTALRVEFLGPGWDNVHARAIRQLSQGSDAFGVFCGKVREGNALLEGRPLYMDELTLRAHILSKSHPDLIDLYEENAARINEIEGINEWHREMVLLNTSRTKAEKKVDERVHAIIEQMMKRSGTQAGLTDNRAAKGQKFTASGSASTSHPPNSNAPDGDGRVRPPQLTAEENKLLRFKWNFGCVRCREFFVFHRSTDGVCDFPDGANYKPRTQRDLDAARRNMSADQRARYIKEGGDVSKLTGAASVNVVLNEVRDENDSDDYETESSDDFSTRGQASVPRGPPVLQK